MGKKSYAAEFYAALKWIHLLFGVLFWLAAAIGLAASSDWMSPLAPFACGCIAFCGVWIAKRLAAGIERDAGSR
jgi:hypothetical protein